MKMIKSEDKMINVIENICENDTECGISFTNNNHDQEDFFVMDKDTAFRLSEYLNKKICRPDIVVCDTCNGKGGAMKCDSCNMGDKFEY
jgi:hypothetical protein